MIPQDKRNKAIDSMRATAIILMIILHVTPYFLTDILTYTVWNYAHFVVPIFVFCSSYIYFAKKKYPDVSVTYFLKRIKRLLIPYYIFMACLVIYSLIVRHGIDRDAILQKLLFLNPGSADLEWLVVLFLYIMILTPLIAWLSKHKVLFSIYTFCSFLSLVLFLFERKLVPYRHIMWLPWSLVIIVAYLTVVYENKRWFFPMLMSIFGGLYLIGWKILVNTNVTRTLTENKYPPNLFYLSYGIFFMLLLYVIYRSVRLPGFIQKGLDFISTYSYSLFFIHFLFIYFFVDIGLQKNLTWWGMTVSITLLAVAIQIIYNKISLFFNIK